VELIIAEAVDILYEAIRKGKKVSNLVAYLWKTSDHKACDYYRTQQQNRKTLTSDELEQIPDPSTKIEDELDSCTQELDWEEK
jgi:DNA-directed RNA polymerase specialized sigma24 family protein